MFGSTSRRHLLAAALMVVFAGLSARAAILLHNEGEVVCEHLERSVQVLPGPRLPCSRTVLADGEEAGRTVYRYDQARRLEEVVHTDFGEGGRGYAVSCSTLGRMTTPLFDYDLWLQHGVSAQLSADHGTFEERSVERTIRRRDGTVRRRVRELRMKSGSAVVIVTSEYDEGERLQRRTRRQGAELAVASESTYHYGTDGDLIELRIRDGQSGSPERVVRFGYDCHDR